MDKLIFVRHAELCQTLASPIRLEILSHLREGEKRVNELAELTELNQANVSQHLALLRSKGLVTTRRDGTSVPVEVNAANTLWYDKIASVFVVRDISLRKQAETTLAREKQRAEGTMASLNDGVITTGIDGVVDYVNPVAERLTGWSNVEARGQPLVKVLNLVDPATHEAAESPAARAIELHTVISEGGMMKMRPVPKMEVKAGGETKLQPGGLHIMLIGMKEPIKEGASVSLTLNFDDGSKLSVTAPVRAAAGGMGMPQHNHMH